ncbi:MFS transporter [Streptosporangium algeriense]|uniref:MFS transporter n=1 Tax=Streptosporangium algeriense TaxID=1682748 RepID=A0ABW3DM75_9ACTN
MSAQANSLAEGSQSGPPVGVRTPQFRRLWWSWTISLCGDGVRFLALPLYVALQSRDPLATGAVAFAETLPWLLGALPAGAIVDRSPPRTVLIAAHGVRAVLTAVLVVAMAMDVDSVTLLCVFAFLLTFAEAFADPASQVMMVHLAGPKDLDEANSRFYAVNTVAITFIGPLAGGLVIAVNPVWAFALDALSFVLAALLVVTLPDFPADPKATGTRLTAGVGEGVRLLLGHPGLRTLVAMVMVAGVASTVFDTLLPLYAVDDLNMDPRTVALLVMAFGVATLACTWLAPRLARRVSDGPVMITGMAMAGGGIALVGLVGSAVAAWTGVVLAGAPVLILSQYVEVSYADDLLADARGAVGYLLKDRVVDVDDFMAGLRAVAAGGTVFDPQVVAQLMVRRRRDDPLAQLTPREREVLGLMAEGRSNPAIGRQLVISDGAVEKHIRSIFAKLGLYAEDGDQHRRVLAVLAYLRS